MIENDYVNTLVKRETDIHTVAHTLRDHRGATIRVVPGERKPEGCSGQ